MKFSNILMVFIFVGLFAIFTVSAKNLEEQAVTGQKTNMNADVLSIGVTPWTGKKTMEQMYAPLIKYLGQATGYRILFKVSDTYTHLGNEIQNKNIDFGFFSPNAYVEAKGLMPNLKYLVTVQKKDPNGDNKEFYHGVIIVLKDSPFHEISDLKQRRFAFTDYSSASGYLYPMVMLKKMNIDPSNFFSHVYMLKKHDRVISSLLQHQIEGGATWDGHLQSQQKQLGDKFRVIATTKPIPFDACASGSHVSPEKEASITAALLNVSKNKMLLKHLQLSGFPYSGFIKLNDSFYDVIRDARQQIDREKL